MNIKFQTKFGHEAEIRELISSDAKNVLEYLKIVGGETNFLLIDQRGLGLSLEEEEKILERFNKHPVSLFYGCFIDEELVAVANLSVSESLRIKHIGQIGITVKKKYWAQGIGSKIMQTIVEYAQENQHIDVLQLEVRADNYRAVNLYETLGFTTIGTMPKAMKVDCVFYDFRLMYLDVSKKD